MYKEENINNLLYHFYINTFNIFSILLPPPFFPAFSPSCLSSLLIYPSISILISFNIFSTLLFLSLTFTDSLWVSVYVIWPRFQNKIDVKFVLTLMSQPNWEYQRIREEAEELVKRFSWRELFLLCESSLHLTADKHSLKAYRVSRVLRGSLIRLKNVFLQLRNPEDQ